MVHFPAGENEHLAVQWLWSGSTGVFSHETALALHELSDVLPAMAHMTVPGSWEQRRLNVPAGLVLHFGDVPKRDRVWHGSIPVTTPARTLRDCAAVHVSPELVERALDDGLLRGLFTVEDAGPAAEDIGDRLRMPTDTGARRDGGE